MKKLKHTKSHFMREIRGVDVDKLKGMLKDLEKSIIGWHIIKI